MQRDKLVYIIPEYSDKTEQHFYHINELLIDLAKTQDIYLIAHISDTVKRPEGVKKYYVQKLPFPLNIFEIFLICVSARLMGYGKFYTHYSYIGGLCSSLAAMFFGGRTFYWHCGLKAEYMSRWDFKLQTLRNIILDDKLFILTLKSVDFLVTGTDSMADYYSKNFQIPKKKILVMANWVNTDRFNPVSFDKAALRKELGLPEKKQVVLFVHHLSERKGANNLLPIILRVYKEHRDVLFIIIGSGPYKKILEKEVLKNGLEGAVLLVGNVPNMNIPGYYALSDIFIMPSNEEGFPRVLIESMAMGIPFVASDVGGVKDILIGEQKDYLVPKGSNNLFAEKVNSLLANPGLRNILKEKGLLNVKKYEKEKIINRFIWIVTHET